VRDDSQASGAAQRQGATSEAITDLVDRIDRLDRQAGSILLCAPSEADGDSLGSELALALILEARYPGLTVHIASDTPVPRRYRFLPGTERVLLPNQVPPGTTHDIAIVLDGCRQRLVATRELFDGASCRILLDHHAVGDDFDYDLRVVDPEVSSTAELVDLVRRHPGIDQPLTPDLAAGLYCALVFDTGYFRHPSTSPVTLRLAADLVGCGIDFTDIGERTILRRSLAGTLLLARVLGELGVAAGGRVIHAAVTRLDLQATGADDQDREGIIDHLGLVEGCAVAVLLSETPEPGVVRCSLRSRGPFDVAALARSLSPEGGGHRAAAGCTLTGELEPWRREIVRQLEEQLA
jgi:phosphoesterase RecJ-like protein